MSDIELRRAKGRAKNARNQLSSMLCRARKNEESIPEDSVEYALEEVKQALEHIETQIE